MTTTTRGVRVAGICALLASCAPAADGAGALPPAAGAYPRAEAAPPPPARRSAGWSPADRFTAAIRVEAGVSGFFVGLPALGSTVPVREISWPAPVRLAGVGDAGVTVQGDLVTAHALAGELRCGGGTDAGVPVQLVVEVLGGAAGLSVEARFEGPEPHECELSALGRRRLQGAAVDVYLWVRAVARTGTEFPASYP
jgi:hypothetical protein